jgi:hypothetical protein
VVKVFISDGLVVIIAVVIVVVMMMRLQCCDGCDNGE